jgi:hypothetical protein
VLQRRPSRCTSQQPTSAVEAQSKANPRPETCSWDTQPRAAERSATALNSSASEAPSSTTSHSGSSKGNARASAASSTCPSPRSVRSALLLISAKSTGWAAA